MPTLFCQITDEQMELLRKRHEETGAPIAHFVRQSLNLLFSGSVAPCSVNLGSGSICSGSILMIQVQ